MYLFNNLIFLVGVLIISSAILESCNGFSAPHSRTSMNLGVRTSSSSRQSTSQTTRKPSSSTIRYAHYASAADVEQSNNNNNNSGNDPSIRDKLRKVTGFSLTAFRATWRAATGISLTAVYASALAVTGLWIRKIMSTILSIFPAWFRYFLQPFLVLYYAPLFIIRGLTGPSRKVAKKKRDTFMEGWKSAIDYAEKTEADGYWPVHANDEGYFELVKPPNPDDKMRVDGLEDAIAESVEDYMEKNEDKK